MHVHCTVPNPVDMPNFRFFPQLTEMQEIGCFNELHNPQNFSDKRYPDNWHNNLQKLTYEGRLFFEAQWSLWDACYSNKSRLTHNNNLFGAFDNVNV